MRQIINGILTSNLQGFRSLTRRPGRVIPRGRASRGCAEGLPASERAHGSAPLHHDDRKGATGTDRKVATDQLGMLLGARAH
jgi:hypothetical protein